MISESFWNNWFNRAPDVVGRQLVIANVPFTVVGVMPKRFFGADPTQRPQIFAPLSADPIIDAPRNHIDAGIDAWWLVVVARLRPGVTVEQANAHLLTVSDSILHETGEPKFIADEEAGHSHFTAEPGAQGFAYTRTIFRKPLAAMLSMCGGILLLACLNMTSLLMARSAARQRELATRLAMGATRRRLAQQLFTESFLLAMLGSVAGLAAAPVVSHSLAVLVKNASAQMDLDTSLDIRVFGFATLIAAVSAVLIGLVPALRATAGNLNDRIKDGQHAKPAHEGKRILPRALMSLEVSLALVLVVGAGLLATSLARLYRSGAGFDPKGLVNIAFAMDKQQLDGDSLIDLYRRLGDGLRRQPGVESVSFQRIVPLSHRGWNDEYVTPVGGAHLIWLNGVSPDYFRTMRIPLYLGREFSWNDTRNSGLKVILNESAAKLFFPGRNPLGQHVVNSSEKASFEVIAVVADAKYGEMRTPAPPAGYVPILQLEEKKPSLSAVVRMSGPQAPLAAAARALSAELTPTIPAPVMSSMDDMVDNSITAERMMAMLGIFFAACALLVTGIGLYGTLAYSTARRTSEIGIRIALGAQRAGVVAMVFRENAMIAVAGSGAGLVVAMVASRLLSSFLYETSPRDPWVLVGSVAALSVISSAASILPALRAARIDPMRALRTE